MYVSFSEVKNISGLMNLPSPGSFLACVVVVEAGAIVPLALEFAQYNILVNAIAPGPVMTPGSAAMADSLQARGVDLNVQTEEFFKRLPLQRLGEPDDIAKVALFLASAAADYMTGSLVLVDGGYLLS